jgi:hypothetical protein
MLAEKFWYEAAASPVPHSLPVAVPATRIDAMGISGVHSQLISRGAVGLFVLISSEFTAPC